ncbi:MAG: chitobiase/beta-hexosaminidase C-terminal domain-containing protein, partial [Clostridiales bacterium]|nr:chitobiase/beta-hexosaminidase C-terminal domain-containing protein [Clostridiales bacterium]
MNRLKSRLAAGAVAVALFCLALGSFVASFDGKPARVAVAAPASPPNTLEELIIGSWCSFYSTDILSYEEQLADLARSGINFMLLPTRISMTDRLDIVPVDQYPMVSEANELYRQNGMYFLGRESELGLPISEELDRIVGYRIIDEPTAGELLSTYGSVFKNTLAADPTRFPYINLFPSYAGAGPLGGTMRNYIDTLFTSVGGPQNLEYLSFDHYPFWPGITNSPTYFSDLEAMRSKAFDNGKIKTAGFTQMGGWATAREPSVSEARWNMNSLVVYGFKMINHFNWVQPYGAQMGERFLPAVLGLDGKPTARYEPMQKLNWQTRQLGDILMSLDVAHAYHTGEVPDGAEALPKSFPFKPSNTSDNMIVSLAEGKNGTDSYVMLLNRDTSGQKTFTINADLRSGAESLTWYKPDDFNVLPQAGPNLVLPAPEAHTIDISKGFFDVTLQAGEMRLYKINGADFEIVEQLWSPEISVASGVYTTPRTVTITAPEGSGVYYTTDGSYPTTSSTPYTGAFTLGTAGQTSFHNLKVIASLRGETSEAVTAYISILPSPIAGGTDLSAAANGAWTVSGGGIWANSGGVITKTDTGSDPPSYTYNVKKFENFALGGSFTVKQNVAGMVGFGLKKKTVGGDITTAGDGVYVVVDNRGV